MYRILLMSIVSVFCFSVMIEPATVGFKGYNFEAFVSNAKSKRYREFDKAGKPLLKVKPNEEYSIIVKNPLPVRVAVAVSVDGLNSIDGKRTTPRNSRKWMIAPHGSLKIEGWQTSSKTLRKFVFTRDEASYAEWKEGKEGKPYARNLGVIGIAYFWNSQELDEVLHPPQPFAEEKAASADYAKRSAPAAPSAASKAESRAGTGMGRQQQNQVTEVEFHEDAGMYSNKDVLVMYYEFAAEAPEPQPFDDDEESEDGRFAPDMNK